MTDERPFHVFYYLLHGTSPEEKSALYLQDYAKRDHVVVDEDEKWAELNGQLKAVGISKSKWIQLTQILAAILHLNQLQFVDDQTQDAAVVRNTATLDVAAELLGVESRALEQVLTYQTKLIKRDLTTIFLNADQATVQRDHLAQTLYSLLFDWIIEALNKKLCKSSFHNFIGIVDFPANDASVQCFEQLCVHLANEKLQMFMTRNPTNGHVETHSDECIQLLTEPTHGLIRLIQEEKRSEALGMFLSANSRNPCLNTKKTPFTIQHFTGPVVYNVSAFGTTPDTMSADFLSLFRREYDAEADEEVQINELARKIFAQRTIATESHPKNTMIVAAQQSSKPRRSPSVRKPKQQQKQQQDAGREKSGPVHQVVEAIEDLIVTLEETKQWWVICLRPNDLLLPSSCDAKKIMAQIKMFQIMQLCKRTKHEYTMQFEIPEFCERYVNLIQTTAVELDAEPTKKCVALSELYEWDESMMIVDEEKVHLNELAWSTLENKQRGMEKREQRRARCIAKGIPFEDEEGMSTSCSHPLSCFGQSMMDAGSIYSVDECYNTVHCYTETESVYSHLCDGDSCGHPQHTETTSMHDSAKPEALPTVTASPATPPAAAQQKKKRTSKSRFFWVILTWFCTWWIPGFVLQWVGGMRRVDIRMAWREKVTLCCLILLLCAVMVWFIAFFGQLVCPHQDLFTQSELQAKSDKDNAYVAVRGEVFDLTSFAPRHWASQVIPTSALFQYAGQDASDLFPVQVSALCDGIDGTVPKEVMLNSHINMTDSNALYHDFRYGKDDYRPDWYFEQMVYLRKNYRLGFMGYDPVDVKNQASYPVQLGGINTNRLWAIVHDDVYDLTSYMMGGRPEPILSSNDTTANATSTTNPAAAGADGTTMNKRPEHISTDFIDNAITELFRQLAGTDISTHFDALPMDRALRDRQLTCMRNLFFVGKVDTRNSFQCLLSEYLLLLITGFLCSVILFKFLAALRLNTKRPLEEYDKFIICQVPCYTEGEESLRKTIDSLTVLRYDDKRKLLFLVADGMIVGSGNDRSTPRIVLDILGADPSVDPEPMSFLSLGEGRKQHNMGKVYSGLYECAGHVVPYIVVVKVGTSQERQKPGNRGKRDSQMVLMRFLNKVHFDSPMTPLELEMHHQLKNVIGVNPTFYEFVLMVDADTEVLPDSLNRMVSCFVHDTKIVGLCGETMLSNEKDTWVTMIQVYEYYISHHLAKAFESLFGSVTCLPGCFCMYRIRSTVRNQPLLASNQVIDDYAENSVDTLHKKNLLHLGEDRYLTTLILKHFPHYKTKFTPDAACMTNAPDRWPVLLSQRRRWINSTVHNLGELMFLPELCGFCCFSMRFVVMLDLLSTLVMPAVVCYLGYLVYQLCTNTSQVPLMSIITLAGVYGLQAIIFILRRKWEHVGWMIVYVLAIPVFSFLIPIYAFWHFDDFSWGNTRIVVGEKGQRKAVGPEEGTFDPLTVPTKRWSEHEREWEKKDTSCSEDDEGRMYDEMTCTCPSEEQAGYFPTDVEMIQAIEQILDEHDLMQLTKKQVRDALSNHFGVDMDVKRDFINQCIEELLAERL
ncbi:hypothetical protein DFQ30_006726 [Apophysomyces sp. BC1015]|nr:hypothetical protein DFQ30_006726 [Apophysomyces sp. BC1015]